MRGLGLAILLVAVVPGSALTVNEVIELNRAGVGEATIIAQMTADRSRFRLDARDLLRLRDEGVSDTLMQAMIATATPAPTATPPPALARPSIAERRRQPVVVTQVLPSWAYAPPICPAPVSYTIGPNPPLFVNGSPGVYAAPACQVPLGCYRPAATYSGQSGTVVIRLGDR
ncbi:MAG: hypothetical protein HUU35_04235 [Armatimonadetes bacterium]|nr:hypothetical protein [Armatimonadota bacterium]